MILIKMYANKNISATLTGWLAYFREDHCATRWWRIQHVRTVFFCEATFSTFDCIIISCQKWAKPRACSHWMKTANVKATFPPANGFLAILMVTSHRGGTNFSLSPSHSVSVNKLYTLRYHTLTHIEFGSHCIKFFPFCFYGFCCVIYEE